MQRIERGVLLILIALGGLLTLLNRSQPLVRNSLVYARASEHVIAHGYDPRPVVADSRLSYDKPILYAWVSAPFVAALGNHDGLRATSFLTTAAYLLALLHFARSFRAVLHERGPALVLLLAGLGPCVAYQFWSAHPDGWFAALVVLAWSLTHRLVTRELPPGRGMLLLGLVLEVAILLKNYGLVLLVACPAYLLWHLGDLRRERERFRRLLGWGGFVFGALALLAWLAWTGANPLSRLEGEGGGVGQYATGELAMSARGTWVGLGLALLLQFHFLLPCAVRRAAWSRALVAPLACFGGTYVLGLMPFPTTFYNMRYFVPLFPLAALVLARGWSAIAAPWRGRWLALQAGVSVLLVVVFGWAPAYRLAAPAIPGLEVSWIGVPLSLLDNLRMPLHLETAAALATIEREVPAGATLYMLDVTYYRDAQQGVYERAGRIRADIATRYVSSRGFAPTEPECYVWSPRPQELAHLGRVVGLGHGFWRLQRGA